MTRRAAIRPWWTLLALMTAIACGPANPGGPGAETLATLELEIAAIVAADTPETLVVTAIGSRGARPLPTFQDAVTLEVDAGTVTPALVAMDAGVGQAQVTFAGATGTVTLTARSGGRTATVAVDVGTLLTAVPGDATASAATALPYLDFRGRPQDYALGAPDLPGLRLSFNTVTLVLDAATTVGELNALLARHGAGIVAFFPGAPDHDLGAIAALRLPTSDHGAMLAALEAVGAEPLVLAVEREFLAPPMEPVETRHAISGAGATGIAPSAITPRPGGDHVPVGWTWERDDEDQPTPDANWGLEWIRVPQAWNLNAYAADLAERVGIEHLFVGVLDAGFFDHPDVDYALLDEGYVDFDNIGSNDHGVHVAGTIAATHGNAIGVDGVHPFARLVARRITLDRSSAWGMIAYLVAHQDVRLVNASLAFNYYAWNPPTNPNTNAAAQNLATWHGRTIAQVLAVERAAGRPRLIVAAAGNDSTHPALANAAIDAKWASMFTAAALIHGSPDVLVVEAHRPEIGALGRKAPFSNTGGHVAAPGVGIVSTAASSPYLSMDGTSMAAPHVTGLVAFLRALEPGLSAPEIGAFLRSVAGRPVLDGAFGIDAFDAAMLLDDRTGTDRILRALLDVDDGTLDGNTRVDPWTGSVVLQDSGNAFGPVGDGRIDMRDFRRLRDALLLVENDALLDLDGPGHRKRDLNLDGIVEETPARENVFPRYDFNGDGLVHRSRPARFREGTGAGTLLTDLQVLQLLWEDPDVAAEDLPALLDSGDVHLDERFGFADPRVAAVAFTFVRAGDGAEWRVRLDRDRPQRVVTLPVGEYDVERQSLDAGDAPLQTSALTLTVTLGGDVAVRPPIQRQSAVGLGRWHGIAVRSDGTVWGWGRATLAPPTYDPTPQQVPGIGNVIAVAAAGMWSLALLADGTVWQWDQSGVLPPDVACATCVPRQLDDLENVIAIFGGGMVGTAFAVTADGDVWGWGYNNDSQLGIGDWGSEPLPVPVPGVPPMATMSPGHDHTLGVTTSGVVWGWGSNRYGQAGQAPLDGDDPNYRREIEFPEPASIGGLERVSSGSDWSLGLAAGGAVSSWGFADAFRLGRDPGAVTNLIAFPPGSVPVPPAVAIAAGVQSGYAVDGTGTVWSWGSNSLGGLGTGIANDARMTPGTVPDLPPVEAVWAGYYVTAALGEDGSLWVWGVNDFGQAGAEPGGACARPLNTTLPCQPTPLKVLELGSPSGQ